MESSQINTEKSSESQKAGFRQRINSNKAKAIRVNLEFTRSNRKIRKMKKILTTKKSSKGKLKKT